MLSRCFVTVSKKLELDDAECFLWDGTDIIGQSSHVNIVCFGQR